MKKVFEEVKIKNMKLRNRLVRSATWEGIAAPDGSIPKEAYDIYRELAKGGIGAVITGFTSVAAEDFYFDGIMRLSDDALIPQYRELAEVIHAEHCPAVSQLALGAYYRESHGSYMQVEPDDMTQEEIRLVIQRFVDAAVRAEQCGFDGVQIHAAHFFFLSRFISPAVNHRTDEYGESTEKRSRILLEILRGIREKAPNLCVGVKINSSDRTLGGLMPGDSLTICRMLDESGIDFIEVSGNGTSVSGILAHVNEGYFADFAAQVSDEVRCPVMVVGGFRALDTMETVLNQSGIELISLSRPLLREPDWPNKLIENPAAISKCISCNRCYSSPSHKCVFRERDKV